MKQIHKKRNTYRLQIRRRDIQYKMNTIRNELTQNLYYHASIKYIKQTIVGNPQKFFNILYQYFENSAEIEKIPYAWGIWQYLTSMHFFQRKQQSNQLPQLLIAIYPFLSQDKKYMLAQPKIISELLYILFNQNEEQERLPSLFNVTFDLCIYRVKQSTFTINFSEEDIQQIIKRAHSQLTETSLQILSITLLSLQRGCIRNCLQPKLKQIARIIKREICSNKNQSILQLNLLTLLECHLELQQNSQEVIEFILNHKYSIDFTLLLKFVMKQSQNNNLSYPDIKQFLLICPPHLKYQNLANQLIFTIQNILDTEFNLQYLVQIYNIVFIGKMKTFINFQTINPMLSFIFWLFKAKDKSIIDEMIDCGLRILQIGANQIKDMDKLIDLSINLLLHNGCSEMELQSLLGEQKYEQVWDHYANGNQECDSI